MADEPTTPAGQSPVSTKPATSPAKPAGAVVPILPKDPEPPPDEKIPVFIATLQTTVPAGVTQLSYWVGDWTVIVPVVDGICKAGYQGVFIYCVSIFFVRFRNICGLFYQCLPSHRSSPW